MKYHLHIGSGNGRQCNPEQFAHWDEARAAANKIRATGVEVLIYASPDRPGRIQKWQLVPEENSNGTGADHPLCR